MTTTAERRRGRTPLVVLWEPQDAVNVGAVIRACMLCDAPELRLVDPRFDDPGRVLKSAPHGDRFLERRTRTVDGWEAAIDGVDAAFAFTARHRNERHARFRLDDVCGSLGEYENVAFVFGREDHGLPNHVLDRCAGYVLLESSRDFRSFNLAQAVMVALHRAFVTVGDPEPLRGPARSFDRPDLATVERMMRDAEQGLDSIGFFKGDHRENVLRTVRRVLLRAEVDEQELATFWALFAELGRLGGGGAAR